MRKIFPCDVREACGDARDFMANAFECADNKAFRAYRKTMWVLEKLRLGEGPVSWGRDECRGGKTAREMNRGKNPKVIILHVPLLNDRQLAMMVQIAESGIWGQTAGEVAATFITDGLIKLYDNPNTRKFVRKS